MGSRVLGFVTQVGLEGGEVFILNSLVFLSRYNVVFKYLLSVRRVQAELQHCWALQMQRKHLKSNQTDAVKWRLRNHMAFLVDNLQYYLQVCVEG